MIKYKVVGTAGTEWEKAVPEGSVVHKRATVSPAYHEIHPCPDYGERIVYMKLTTWSDAQCAQFLRKRDIHAPTTEEKYDKK